MIRTLGKTLFSEDEFLALPESMDHIELIDGEVILAPAPLFSHQELVGRLHFELLAWARKHPPARVGLAPVDLRLAAGRIVQPDLFLVLSGSSRLRKRPIDVVPDLVIEVLSSNRSHDRMTKRLLYAEAGVPEYWLVDPVACSIEVVAGLETREIAHKKLASRQAKGLVIDVVALFRDLI